MSSLKSSGRYSRTLSWPGIVVVQYFRSSPLAKGMDPLYLKSEYGKDLTFFGGIDVQELLPTGSPQMVRDEVRRRIDILGKNGGYIIGPAHNIQPDTSVENVLAFFEAALAP